jgi:hypothetical protein
VPADSGGSGLRDEATVVAAFSRDLLSKPTPKESKLSDSVGQNGEVSQRPEASQGSVGSMHGGMRVLGHPAKAQSYGSQYLSGRDLEATLTVPVVEVNASEQAVFVRNSQSAKGQETREHNTVDFEKRGLEQKLPAAIVQLTNSAPPAAAVPRNSVLATQAVVSKLPGPKLLPGRKANRSPAEQVAYIKSEAMTYRVLTQAATVRKARVPTCYGLTHDMATDW